MSDLLFLYTVTTEPQPAVGWTTHEVLAIMDTETGKLRFHQEVGRDGQATTHERCDWQARVERPDCKDDVVLILDQTCGENWCFDISVEDAEDPDEETAERLKECSPPTTSSRTCDLPR